MLNTSGTGYVLINEGGGFVGIGTNHPKARLDILGSLLLRSTGAPSSPQFGHVYNDGTDLLYYDGSAWADLTAGATTVWTESGANVYRASGNVGINELR